MINIWSNILYFNAVQFLARGEANSAFWTPPCVEYCSNTVIDTVLLFCSPSSRADESGEAQVSSKKGSADRQKPNSSSKKAARACLIFRGIIHIRQIMYQFYIKKKRAGWAESEHTPEAKLDYFNSLFAPQN